MYLLLRDPLTHGRAVLEQKCLGCHYYGGKGAGKQTASDLEDFGSYAWIRGLLEDPKSAGHFGAVAQCDGMVEWKKSTKLKDKQLDDVARFVASFAAIPADQIPEEWLNSPGVADNPGLEPLQKQCGACHVIDGLSEGGTRDAPKLFAWGWPKWMTRMIRKPGTPDLYGYLEPKD
jgi:ubiquinol-cytochrome c reductase cytochrome b subunit